MKSLRWLFELVDKTSGPARSIAGELGAVERQMKAVDRASRQARLAGAQNTAAGRAQLRGLGQQRRYLRDLHAELAERNGGGLAGGFELAGMAATSWLGVAATIATTAGVAAVGVGRLAYAFGDAVVEATAFREGTLASLSTVLGSQAAATRTFANAIRIANATPLDTTGVVGMASNFAVAGFGERDLQPLIAASADIAAARGQSAANSFALVLSQIRGMNRVQRGDITMQGISAGLNVGDILDSIARQRNLHGTQDQMRRAAMALVSKGKIDGAVGINAFLDAAARAYDNGGPLGTFARRQSETLVGALSNARNAATNLLLALDLEKIPGILAFKRVILQITAALDAGSPIGKRLGNVIRQLTDTLFGGLFGNVERSGINGFLNRFLDGAEGINGVLRRVVPIARAFFEGILGGAAETLGPVAQAMGATFGGKGQSDLAAMRENARGFGTQLGQLLANMLLLIPAVVALVAALVSVVLWCSAVSKEVGAFGKEVRGVISDALGPGTGEYLGGAFVGGITAGIRAAMPGPMQAAVEMAGGLVGAVKSVLKIASPSKVMAELGRFTAEGFTVGLEGGRAGVQGAAGRMVEAPDARQLGRGGATLQMGDVNIVVKDGDDAEDTGRRAARGFLDELAEGLELLNLQMA